MVIRNPSVSKVAVLMTTSLCTLLSSSAYADGIVFDPSNFAKNSITAVQTLETAKNTLNSYQELIHTYDQLKSQYNLTVTDLRELANITQLLKSMGDTVNGYYGSSPLSQLSQLDPKSGDYTQKRDAILTQYYQKPTDPNQIQATFQGMVNQSEIDTMKEKAKSQTLDYQLLQDNVDESTHEQALAKERSKDIQAYGNTLSSLGPNSSVRTQQTTASEVNFLLQQQEQVIQQHNEQLKYTRMQKAEEESEKAKQSQAEQASLQKAMNQGTKGLGRDRWGDF